MFPFQKIWIGTSQGKIKSKDNWNHAAQTPCLLLGMQYDIIWSPITLTASPPLVLIQTTFVTFPLASSISSLLAFPRRCAIVLGAPLSWGYHQNKVLIMNTNTQLATWNKKENTRCDRWIHQREEPKKIQFWNVEKEKHNKQHKKLWRKSHQCNGSRRCQNFWPWEQRKEIWTMQEGQR